MDQPTNTLFTAQKVNEEGLKRIESIRGKFIDTLATIIALAGDGADGRQIAMVKTHMEDACLHAVKAVSLNPNLQA